MNKKELRKLLLQKRNRLDADYRNDANEKITEAFLRSSLYQNAKSLFIYISYSSEVNTHQIISRALKDNKTVLVPDTAPGNGVMEAVQITDFQMQLCPTCYGILEPNFDSTHPYNPADIDLIVVPGIAFDRAGYRMGYGGGYYDRYLSRAINAKSIGLCYEETLEVSLPREPHDKQVHIILTESEEYRIL